MGKEHLHHSREHGKGEPDPLPQGGLDPPLLPERKVRHELRPEDILTSEEAELLQRASRGELPCPQCSKPLQASVIRSDVYNGILLFCECGFQEY